MMRRTAHIVLVGTTLFAYSCKDMPAKNHGPIVLGDSSTIVTETDQRRLQDFVTDLKPDIPPAEDRDTVAKKVATADTVKKVEPAKQSTPAAQPQLSPSQGLVADFKDVSIQLTGIAARQSGKADLTHANGAVYTLTSGNVPGATMRIKGTVTKVSQRYQTVVLLRSSDLGTIQLDAFGGTSDWKPLNGAGGQYRIAGLDANALDYPDANNNNIRAAVTKTAKHRRMSRAKLEDLLDDVKKVKDLNQKPLSVVLRSVMWKIDGKDAQGRAFSKQIRIDIPIP